MGFPHPQSVDAGVQRFIAAGVPPAKIVTLRGKGQGGRWALKNPWHPLFLDDLVTVYPDAQLVMTHRDPVEVVASAASLIRLVRPMFSDTVDLKEIAQQIIEKRRVVDADSWLPAHERTP